MASPRVHRVVSSVSALYLIFLSCLSWSVVSYAQPSASLPARFAPIEALATTASRTAQPAPERQARLAIVLDDIGYSKSLATRAIKLPVALSLAVLPNTPHGSALARKAHQNGKQIIIHMPMRAMGKRRLDRGGIDVGQSAIDIGSRIMNAFAKVPHASGLSNHEGSLLTANRKMMTRLMLTMRMQGVTLFVDSRTTAESVAAHAARRAGLRVAERDVFLDHDPAPASIRKQLQRAAAHARRHGTALAIGHPYPSTISILERQLAGLARDGIEFITLDQLVEIQGTTTPTIKLVNQSTDQH